MRGRQGRQPLGKIAEGLAPGPGTASPELVEGDRRLGATTLAPQQLARLSLIGACQSQGSGLLWRLALMQRYARANTVTK